jgi:hypothetical protein|tara:strand:+ start:1830 stop:2075 length:246 start_codon:yes stop_codon:yes gene_type:complete
MNDQKHTMSVGNITFGSMTPGELIRTAAQQQATIESLTKKKAALPQVHTCGDCAEIARLNSREPCFSCRWNPNLHDNWRAE